ncbi:type II toxin-antitoxin system HipA family toxin [Saccharospirillum sp.]|uniref:type II toxin-antitoxin system HipA family toxin n=1 Tax=Saccharospirillum sp. TaxID=2033801 RepID=UPI00349FE936
MTAPYTQAYVFAVNADNEQQWAGTLATADGMGTFHYTQYWLEHPSAYPLDPVNLPLEPRTFRVQNPKGVFGVFTDAGPDDWGTRLMLMHQASAPRNEVERLLRTSGGGVGVLEFSLSRSRPRQPAKPAPMAWLEQLADVTDRVQRREVLTQEQWALIEPGSSMGGARPKTVVTDGTAQWLVKLSRDSDLVDIPRLEYATLALLKDAGWPVPEVQLKALGAGRSALLVRRFDRDPAQPVHFISANSLFNLARLRPIRDSLKNPYSYVNLAGILRRQAANPKQAGQDLYRRMVFNLLIGNTDDHARNHGMTLDIKSGTWSLAPVYDVLPTVGSPGGKQAMGVGRNGADSTLENALSYCTLFGLTESEAQAVIKNTQHLAQQLSDYLTKASLTEADKAIVVGRRLT